MMSPSHKALEWAERTFGLKGFCSAAFSNAEYSLSERRLPLKRARWGDETCIPLWWKASVSDGGGLENDGTFNASKTLGPDPSAGYRD